MTHSWEGSLSSANSGPSLCVNLCLKFHHYGPAGSLNQDFPPILKRTSSSTLLFPEGSRNGMGNSPHLCTVTLSLPGGGDKIGHDHKGAVPLEVRGRGRARQRSELGEEPGECQHGPGQPQEPTGPPAASTLVTSEWGDITRLHLSLVHGETEAQREREERGWSHREAGQNLTQL